MSGVAKKIKESLAKALMQDDVDYSMILSLANDLAKQDANNVRFSVDASHISRLGLELVSKQETAVAELVKNAYDADALAITLVFKNSSVVGGELEITDNGHGMSHEQLLNGFMRISTQDKADSPISSKYKRQKAGRKGIGRFSTQRLGRKLEVITQLETENYALFLEIDWDSFEGGKDIHLISNQVKRVPPMAQSGTVLKIINLRDAWTKTQIVRSFRYVSELLQPFPLGKDSSNEETKKMEDPGFKVNFFAVEQEVAPVLIASEEASIDTHALAVFTGGVDASGVAYFGVTSDKYKIDFTNKPLEPMPKQRSKSNAHTQSYSLLSGVSIQVRYFITEELPSGTRTMVREMLNRCGGVRVYRNGFRVLPYGESFDDWLGLQRSSALRELLPPHHNTNFLGFVEINDLEGSRFEETASREGLLENDAFLQLQEFAYRVVRSGVVALAVARNKKVYASDEPINRSNESQLTPVERAATVVKRLEEFANFVHSSAPKDGAERLNMETDRIKDLALEIKKIGQQSQEYYEQSQERLEENGMLRVLASLGLTIGEFTHEVRHVIAAMNVTISGLAKGGVTSPESIESIKNHLVLLRSYVRYFDNAIAQNAHRELQAYELRDIIHEFAEVIQPTLTRKHIKLTTKFNGYDLFAKPMHKSEWASIFLNLFTNSVKAIDRAGTDNGLIHIAVNVIEDRLVIEFSDNGDGIPRENKENVFEAFFSTSAPLSMLSGDSELLVGTGLGLKIVRDIVDAANGEIEVVEPSQNYSTCIRVEIPRASDEEIGDGKY